MCERRSDDALSYKSLILWRPGGKGQWQEVDKIPVITCMICTSVTPMQTHVFQCIHVWRKASNGVNAISNSTEISMQPVMCEASLGDDRASHSEAKGSFNQASSSRSRVSYLLRPVGTFGFLSKRHWPHTLPSIFTLLTWISLPTERQKACAYTEGHLYWCY